MLAKKQLNTEPELASGIHPISEKPPLSEIVLPSETDDLEALLQLESSGAETVIMGEINLTDINEETTEINAVSRIGEKQIYRLALMEKGGETIGFTTNEHFLKEQGAKNQRERIERISGAA